MPKNSTSKPGQDYEVGFKKPPKETRFKPGQSGNPRGRPKVEHDPHKLLDNYFNEFVEVEKDGRRVRMTKLRLFMERLAQDAIKGDNTARKIVLPFVLPPKPLDQEIPTGVLVVPSPPDPEEWEKAVANHQAKYAGNTGEPKD